MKHVLQVLKFEYLSCVKSKSFIISTVIFMLLILLTTFKALIFSQHLRDNRISCIQIHTPFVC